MKIVNEKIVECTEDELFDYYLTRNLDDFMSFDEYKRNCERNGTTIVSDDVFDMKIE